MNTNDLPPAAKLAVLIEAGRAANPDLKHSACYREHEGSRMVACCSMTMAALGAGVPRGEMERALSASELIGKALQIGSPFESELWLDTSLANGSASSFDEIILSLREGELAKVPA